MSLPSHEELKELFEKDPAAFEVERKRLIDEHISKQPEERQEALRSTQASVDAKL